MGLTMEKMPGDIAGKLLEHSIMVKFKEHLLKSLVIV
jgi:hypothetical protein